MHVRHARPGTLALAAVLACACGSRDPVDADSGGAALMRNLLRAGRVEVCVRAGPLSEPAQRAALRRERARDGYEMRVTAPGSSSDPEAARVLVGSREDPEVLALVQRMGVVVVDEPGRRSFAIDDQVFSAPGDAFVACFEDPERRGLPLTLYYGNRAEELARLVERDLAAGWKPSLSAWRAGREAIGGPLALDGHIAGAKLARPSGTRADAELKSTPLQDEERHFTGRVQEGCDPARLAECLEHAARARAAVHAWAAPQAPLPVLQLSVFARAEDYRRVSGSSDLGWLDPATRELRLCVAPGLPLDGGAEAARAALRELLDESVAPWVEDGAAVDAANQWWGVELGRWLAWIEKGRLVLPLAELVDARAPERVSPHLVLPLRAALFHFLRETRGDSYARQLWQGTQLFVPDEALERAFAEALARRTAPWSAELARPRTSTLPAARADGKLAWRGVESEQGCVGPGWASAACQAGLADLQQLGVNALALRVSLVARPGPCALPDPLHAPRLGTREGDLALFSVLAAAREQRSATLLDVELLAEPAGVEHGAWQRSSEEGWTRFFAEERAAVLHTALVAELAHVDVLSIGFGLSAVTRDQKEGRKGRLEDVEAKLRGWTSVIASARQAYGGALTYISGSLTEAPFIAFWKDLDAIGFRLEAELLPAERGGPFVARAELAAHMKLVLDEVAALAAREKKPWFLARTGFEALSATPGLPRFGAGASDAEGQAAQLEVLGSSLLKLARESRPFGVFLWRWPPDPADRGLDPRDAVLTRPEALEAIRKLYRVL